MIARQSESFQHRQASTHGGLQFLQRFFHRAFRLTDRCARTSLGSCALPLCDAAISHAKRRSEQKRGSTARAESNSANRRPARTNSARSWHLLQLVATNPSVLAVVGFHAVPVRRRNQNQHFGAGSRDFNVLAVWNGADLSGAPGFLTSRSTWRRSSATCCSSDSAGAARMPPTIGERRRLPSSLAIRIYDGRPLRETFPPVECSADLCRCAKAEVLLCQAFLLFLLAPRRFPFSSARSRPDGPECPCTRCFRPSRSMGGRCAENPPQTERQCAARCSCRPGACTT